MEPIHKAVCVTVALIALVSIILIVSLNATNWIALSNGYCQQQLIGSQWLSWQKCK